MTLELAAAVDRLTWTMRGRMIDWRHPTPRLAFYTRPA